MALVNPPDGWQVQGSTVWGTHVDESTTILRSGERSIHFFSGSFGFEPAIRLENDSLIPVDENRDYLCQFTARESNITAGNNMRYRVSWLDQSKTFISTTVAISTVMSVANTFETFSAIVTPATNARFARILLGKADGTFDGYIDDYLFVDATPRLLAGRITSNQTGVTTGTTIIYNDEVEAVGCSLNTSTGVLTINEPGVWFMTATVLVTDPTADDRYKIGIEKNAVPGDVAQGQTCVFTASTTLLSMFLHCSGAALFDAGDTAEVSIEHDASGRTVGSGSGTAWRAFRVE